MSRRPPAEPGQGTLGFLVNKGGDPTLQGRQQLPAATRRYLDSLAPSNCPGCGRVQKTPRGEPVMCPRCIRPHRVIAHPTIPLGTPPKAKATRRSKK